MHIPQSKKEKSAVLSIAMLVAFLHACHPRLKGYFGCAFSSLSSKRQRGVGGQQNKLDLAAKNSISRPLLSLFYPFFLPSCSLMGLSFVSYVYPWMGYDGWMEVDSFDSFTSVAKTINNQQTIRENNKQTDITIETGRKVRRSEWAL